ncbi:MAG: 2-amino-4-hydroxy-6-hydroxymethyldihydropteridine diphosphokinase [Bacteroidales bacterium]|nr:2-amino-4-hydroxy-6-hydroxymethyldihydropteridine diphosphokinase [Bacteroidales bacterium]
MREVFLLLGSNRGNRRELLQQAKDMITKKTGIILQFSGIYETEPWGFEDPIPFLNQTIEIETLLPPEKLLETLLDIEKTLGRIRPVKGFGCSLGNGNYDDSYPAFGNTVPAYYGRTMDIDILFYGTKLFFTDTLMIPHPRLHERFFALRPLLDIAPKFMHPILRKTITTLLMEMGDKR